MEYLDGFTALAGPPSLETCTRDVYDCNTMLVHGRSMVTCLLDALVRLHNAKMSHSDLYAHNILIRNQGEDLKLTDWGAACFYDDQLNLEPIEMRAFAVLVEEIAERANNDVLLSVLVERCRTETRFEAVQDWWRRCAFIKATTRA
jgi:serine/threonine protein kinase